MRSKKKLLYIQLLFAFCFSCVANETAAQEPYKIVTQDVYHFWEAFDALKADIDTTAIFQKLVLDRASVPFKAFIKKGSITARQYTSLIRSFPKFYQSLKTNTLKLCQSEKEIRLLIQKFKRHYPNLVEADICLGIGNFYTGGTVHVTGDTRLVYIGLEYHGLDSSAIVSEFNPVMKAYLSRSNFFRTIIHELTHVQQETHGKDVKRSYYGDKLIHAVLREGIPDFVAKLLYPPGNDGDYVQYGLLHENVLKEKLKNELWAEDKSYWMYNSKPTAGQPSDLGYFMGSRIARAYYQKNKHTPGVLQQIIELTDVKKFLTESGYFTE